MIRLLKRFLRFSLTFGVLLLVTEGVLQLIDFPNSAFTAPFRCPDGGRPDIISAEYHHNYRPNNTFYRVPGPFDEFEEVEMNINAAGLRGPDIPAKNTGEKRLLLLGDSFMQAAEVQFSRTAGEVLNGMYDGDSLHVIQHGVRSWSPLLELNWIVRDGLSLEPDHVVLFLVINDFYVDYPYGDEAYAKIASFDEEGLPTAFDTESKKKVKFRQKKPFYKKLKLMLLATNLLRNYFANRDMGPQWSQATIDYMMQVDKPDLDMVLDSIIDIEGTETKSLIRNFVRFSRPLDKLDDKAAQNLEQSFSYIEKIHDILKSRGIGLTLTMVPTAWNVDTDENALGRKFYHFAEAVLPMGSIEERARIFCKEKQIRFLDIKQAFRRYKDSGATKPLFLKSDGHWNEGGHEVVAELIRDSLQWWRPPVADTSATEDLKGAGISL